jgi:hypothetical protein
MTVSAAVRLRPTPPALRLIRRAALCPFGFDRAVAVLGVAGQQRMGDFALVQFFFYQRQHGGELGKEQNAPALFSNSGTMVRSRSSFAESVTRLA